MALLVLCFGAMPAYAQSGTIDLSLTKAISSQNPAIGDVVTYTVTVTNAPGAATTATGVTVTDQIAADGATYVPNSATVSAGTFASVSSATLVTGTWTIPSIAPGASATLVFKATVKARGVWFNTAEVTKADQTDLDSTPNNGVVAEDDFEAVCFALPIFFYQGDEYTVAIPAGFDRIEWTRDGVPISTSAVSASLAIVNSDNSLTIKSVGTYAFTTYKNNCPSTNCCSIILIPGQFGSLGDFVWEDKNADGKQDVGEPGVVGVPVQLFNRDGITLLASTTTTVGGAYSFTGLTDGGYIVKFGTPTGFTATLANVGDDAKDSDAGANGLTGVYTIDTSQPVSSTARNNTTVDAGFYKPASLGDNVFADNNGNGIQDAGDTPIAGVTVTLLLNGSAVATTTTASSGTNIGSYSFTGLTPGTANVYSVSFTAPAGLTATMPLSGTDRANDSNVNPVTGLSDSVTLTSGEYNSTIDAGYLSPKASLGDKVFADLNANGIQDAGEPGIPGVLVTLITNGAPTSTTLLTDANGEYRFAGLTPGNSLSYAVGFGKPAGFTTTQALSGTNRSNDSDADVITGVSGSVTLASGAYNSTIDAGYVPGFDVGIVKSVLSEKGSYLPGDAITYQLLVSNNSAYPVYNVVVQDLLPAGLSYVSGAGFVASGQSLSTVLAGPLTASGTAGSTSSLTFTAQISAGVSGTTVTNIAVVTPFTSVSNTDGYAPVDSNPQNNTSTVTVPLGNFACVGDRVFADLNGNGLQDDGNTGINGVKVTLYINGSATSQTLVTANGGPDNGPGYYKFANLTPGGSFSYSVGFGRPDGFTTTQPMSGTDRGNDSDADVVTGVSGSVTLASGEFNKTIDAGYVPNAPLVTSVIVAVAPPVCDPATNIYTTTGTVSFTNVTPGKVIIITDSEVGSGRVVATINVVEGQTSASFSLSGISNGPTSHTVQATVNYAVGSGSFTDAVYIAPASCTVVTPPTPVIAIAVVAPVCNPVTNTYTTTGTVSFTNIVAGTLTITDNGTPVATLTLVAGQTSAPFTLTGISNGPASRTVTAALSGTAGLAASTTYAVPASCTVVTPPTPAIAIAVVAPVCNEATNTYVTTGTVSFTNIIPGTLIITDNGTPIATLTITAGQTSAPFSVSGISNGPASRTLTAALSGTAGLAASTTYAVPASCTVVTPPTPAIAIAVVAPVCNPVTNTYTTTGTVSFTNIVAGTLTITDNGTPVATLTLVAGQTSAPFTLTGVSNGPASRTVTAALSGTAGLAASTTYAVPASCTVVTPPTPAIAIAVVAPVCNEATNTYVTTGTVSFTNIIPGTLIITDNGTPIATLTITAGQTSVPFSVSGISNGPASRTLTATLGGVVTMIKSTTYAVPESCTRATPLTPVLAISVTDPAVCNPETNNYTSTGVVSFTNVIPGTLIITDNGTPIATLTITAGQTSVPFSVSGISNGPASRTLTATLSGTATLSSSTTYAVPESCTKVNCPTNYSLTVTADAKICNGESTTLVASTPLSNAKVCWYLTPYEGTALNSLDSGTPFVVNPTTTTVYYAEVVTVTNNVTCVSGRKPVVVTVTTVPTPICLSNIKNACPKTTVDLTGIAVQNQESSLTYEWFTSIDRAANTRVTNLTAVGAGKFYLFARNGVCYSNPTVLTVEIVDCNCQNIAGVNVGPGVSSCASDLIPLKAVLSGSATSVVWSTSGTGSFSNPASLSTTYTPSAADIASGSVLLTATTNDPDGNGVCQAATSSLIATLNKRPEAPVSVACDDTLVCQGSSTKLIGFAPGATINWFDQDNKLVGTTQSGGKLIVTPSRVGAIVYTAQAVGAAGCLSTPTPVTVVVGSCLADLAVKKTVVTAGPYKVGQKITYSITATNNGPITGTSVSVRDILPATLTFVSATPAAEYSAGTGNWTIGTLTTGSSRNLLIEATVTASGLTKNTARIVGSNNDPKYPLNDTSSVTIDVPVCTVVAPHIACAITRICEGGSTTLVAQGCEGTVKWSDGQMGASVVVSPKLTTTYTASCLQSASCVSGASNPITVTVGTSQPPVITASSDNVCPGSSVTLTASGCEGGVIEWSIGQKGNAIVVVPANKTTYTAQCVIGSCPSRPATKTIGITTDVPTPTITCSTTIACPGEEVTLTVNGCIGTPVWNSTTATTASIVVRPAIGANTYSVYCQSNGCRSASSKVYSISVVPAAVPTVVASADSVCAGAPVSLTAAGCNGTVVWNAMDKSGNALTGSVITVNPTASMSYFAQCRYRACLSEPSNAIPVKVVNPQTPQVSLTSGKNVVCSGEKVTLTAEGCEGTVKWYGIDRVGASISFFPTATASYSATCKQGSCESDPSLSIRITVTTSGTVNAPTVVASTTALCGSGVVSLTATGCAGGMITWSDGQTGPVVSVTATPTYNEFYAICTATSGTACGSSRSNTIKVKVTDLPKPTVICSTDQICPGEEVTLNVNNCVGLPMWSTGETTASIVVSPTVTTGYTVMCQEGICKSPLSVTYTITVTPVPTPTIMASATTVEAGGTVTLTATGCNGEVIWSANGVNGANTGTTLAVMPVGTQTYYAQCRFRTCLSNPSVTITINPGNCIAKAGTLAPVNSTICSGTAMVSTLAATVAGGIVQPQGYSVLYVLTKGADLIIQQTSATPTFSVTNATGLYTIHTLVYNANVADPNFLDLSVVKPGLTTGADVLKLIAEKKICADLDAAGARVNVKRIAPPTVTPHGQMTVCAGTVVTYTASGCEGGTIKWSNGDTGASITKTVVADLWVMANCTIDGCTSDWSQTIDYIVGTPGVPTIVVDKPTACAGETVTLTATGCNGGQYIWSDNKTTGSTLSFVIGSADVSYRVKCKVAECEGAWSATTTIKAGSPNAPTVSIAGNGTATVTSATACFGSPVTLVAQGCPAGSYVTWSNNQVGQTLTVSLASGQTFTAQCCASTTCKSAPSNPVSVAVLPKIAAPKVVDKTNGCPINTVDLTTAVTSQVTTLGGMFEFYSDASLRSKLTNTNVGTGTYYAVEKTTDGCFSLPVAIHVMITSCTEIAPCDPQKPVTASAGSDATVCAAKSYQLAGVVGGAGKTAHWTTSGTGIFSNPFAANATYTASAEDVLAGTVTLTLTGMSNNTACATVKDEMVLTIDGVKSTPIVQVVGSTNLCYGDSVKLVAPAGAAGYLWSNNARTSSIFVRNSGDYTVQLINAGGCSSVASEKVTVKVADPAAIPLVQNLRNTCPATVANLTSALSATTAGSTYEYRIGAPVWSKQISRPDSVGTGTYFVFERSATGCLSAPAKVMVNIINCAADTISTDLAISKLASTSVVTNGQPVTYTIKVTNNGTHTAKNIDVRDVLPAGLDLVPGSVAGFTVSNGTITKRIDSLMAGKSDSIVFQARVTKKGVVTNTAEITYADQKDPNTANNRASVSITNTSAALPSVIGLAKAVMGTPTAVGDSLIRVSYRFVATNFGDDTLRKVQVVDDLAYFFVPNTIQSAVVSMANGSTLKPSVAFTGTGAGSTNMLDSASFIAPNRSQIFTLEVVVKRAAGDTTKAFRNIAIASAMNSVTMVEDMSTDGGDTDPDNDGNPANNSVLTSFTLGATQPQGPAIGLALAVTSVKPDGDDTYLICYRATIKNLGDVDLTGITLIDSLGKAFAAPVSFTVTKTQVGAGSSFVLNTAYDGSTVTNVLDASSTLMAGQMDTILIAVRVKVDGNKGPFFSSATATGTVTSTSQTVSDISNNGLDPILEGAISTPVRFDLPAGLIGVAKSVGKPVEVSTGVFNIPYTIAVKNCGTVPLTKVQVVDNLSEAFGNGALIVSNTIAVSAGAGLTPNPNYTGQGLITNMLIDSMSTLQAGEIRTLTFMVQVDVRNADVLTFNNTAKATAQMPDKTVVEDQSTAGTNEDPDNDLDPRNNSAPTPISLNSVNTASSIGIAMAIRDTVRQADGTFNVTYQVVVKNYGAETLKNVSVSDTLSKVFNSLTGASYRVVSPPVSIATGSTLKLNPNFDGGANPLLVLGDSTSTLAAGQVDSLLIVVNVATDGSTVTYLNSAYAEARASTGLVRDISTSGLNPDLNGNGNPTDANEREATALNLPATSSALFIPEGFSPNGDGVNDLFVIRGTGANTIGLEVYNRWGNLVYKNEDYRNNWDGKANTGILISGDADGLPVGTYFYKINLSDGRQFVRYMTINR